MRASALVSISILVLGCSAPAPVVSDAPPSMGSSQAPTPLPSVATAAPASPGFSPGPSPFVFTSTRGYSLSVPGGWIVQDPEPDPNAPDGIRPVDRFTGPRSEKLRVIRLPATEIGSTLADVVGFVTSGLAARCEEPETPEATQLGSEPALFFAVECFPRYLYHTVALHRDDGYIVILDTSAGDNEATDRTMFKSIVETFAFDSD